ncbi:xylulokinase [Palleronia aestuarii]|uniref:Xylulose kinase n=1 Tax=Palleronia aestuarii TaxID=568105 RepID=A0A2W7MQM9_9RHOB|nr:xylulokinase [Palleronia aestuarii]PZX10535.1 xylulokinase [Palleronia aestuarii]
MAYLGIDIGTSGCKALVLSPEGEILATHTAAYDFDRPQFGWTEQDPRVWIEGARTSVANVLRTVPADRIVAVGLSGQMHGFTPLDREGQVLRPAILWNDQRNAAEAADIVEMAGGPDALLSMTNNDMLTGYTAGKILWMQRKEPGLFEKVAHALNPKDYLRCILTGEYATEVSDASGTGLFDVRRRSWSGDLLSKLPFDADMLPECHESDVISGQVSRSGAELFRLAPGTPVIGGGGDSVIQTLGTSVVRPGALQTTIGTGGIIAAALTSPADNPEGRLQVFCNVAPDLWHCMGVSLNSGASLAWLARLLGADDYAALVTRAAEVPAGSEGLVFLPYLNGERCPHPDPTARGAFVGLTGRHDARHMTRAVMEGIVFAFYDIYRLMARMGIKKSLIKASGGGARSDLWRQMQADVFGCPVVTTLGAAEGGAFGAALLTGVAHGTWSDVVEAAKVCRDLSQQTPDLHASETYAKAFDIYADLYPSLRPSFDAIGGYPSDATEKDA